MIKKIFLLAFAAMTLFWACAPDRDDLITLPDPPAAPDFAIETIPNDSNRIIVRNLSAGNFQLLWDLPQGLPKNSSKAVDTIYYKNKGTYSVTLYVSKADGSGTVSTTKQVEILTDAIPECNPTMALLTGDCEAPGKCWTLSHAAGAVKVGPTYDDFSWFTSTENGLQDAQYDDAYCFKFNNLVFEYNNNGLTVNPWDGYQAQEYPTAPSEFEYSVGTGTMGRSQIILPEGQFMGVRDADNVLDVITLTDSELIVRTRICDAAGVPAAEGWFELTFVKQ
jgi:hypothetical protein